MDPQDGQDAEADIRDVRIRGPRLLLRALQPGEIEEEWQYARRGVRVTRRRVMTQAQPADTLAGCMSQQ
jgi:hypothetical protein